MARRDGTSADDKIFLVLLLILTSNENCAALRLGEECGERNPGQLVCGCSNIDSGMGSDTTSLSVAINPVLRSLRPSSQISQLVLRGCNSLRLALDTDRLERNAAQLTDINFEDMQSLLLEFLSSTSQSGRRFVFTDIEQLQLTGQLGIRSDRSGVELYFLRSDHLKSANVKLLRLTALAAVKLLNFQDIEHLLVVDSNFINLDTVEILHTTSCHAGLEERTVPCTRSDLFPYSRPDVDPTDDPYPPFRPSYTIASLSPFGAEQQTQDEITSSPIFIVGMVLLAAIISLALIVFVFLRYKRRRGSSRELLR